MPEQPTILYIEDNADNQRLVARVLEARGYRILLADDGPSGIEIASNTLLAMVLVDINIPTLDGFETTTRLRSVEHLRATPIVALTADTQAGTRERSLAAGCDGYLTKPIDSRRLPAQILEFIAGKREALPATEETQVLREYSQRLVQRLEQQVQEALAANRELRKLDELKSQFIATISHELRTPLTAIVGYLELFERGTLGELQPAQVQAMHVVSRNASQLADQLNSLIYLQQVRGTQIKRSPFLVHDVLRRVVSDLEHRAEDGGVRLRTQLQPTALYKGDASGIEHALRQIIDNAIKFTPHGGQVSVAIQDLNNSIVVRVRDSGIGIPDDQIERVFEPFVQIGSNMARSQNGVGVGLAVVKHVVEAHNGEVSLRSEMGKGTQVQLVLPR